ncbi:MAG TPA: hypothetical protein VNH11_22620 [Pirellulales bacterium]|nr:hypothetical protein [Pirellulales bacterium]HVC97565.1 hypothetical protein [Pirellulales bacterium]
MNLSTAQIEAIKQGEPVRIDAPEVGTDCFVVRADVFERIKTLLYDDEPLSPDEKTRLLVEAGLRAGWDDPEMDIYNRELP